MTKDTNISASFSKLYLSLAGNSVTSLWFLIPWDYSVTLLLSLNK